MSSTSSTIVQRLWNYCNVLRDDGVSYGDYVEQLTYLLFLKMDDENVCQLSKASMIPDELNWRSLLLGLGGAKVKITLEIEAEIPSGAPEQVVRMV